MTTISRPHTVAALGRGEGQASPVVAGMGAARTTRIAIALGAIGALAVGGCGHGSGASAENASQAAIVVGVENIALVATGTLRTGPVISGTLAPIRNAQLRAQIGGSVVRIEADQGEHVADSSELARIDAAGLRDAELSARSQFHSAQVAADYAAREVQRYDTLFAAGAVSDRDRESVVQQNAQAQAALSDGRARLVAAEKQLEYTVVRAPFGGIVADRDVSVGDVVQPGTLMFTVVDPSQLQLDASVPAEQIAAVRVGQPVAFNLNGYGNRIFRGSVMRISPIADPSTRQIRVYATIPNPDNALVAGLFATGRVVTDSSRGLIVPTEAIDMRNLNPVVERVHQGRVQRVDVALGLRDAQADQVQIVSGVSAGDTLLRGAAQAITPGTLVRVTAIGDSATAER